MSPSTRSISGCGHLQNPRDGWRKNNRQMWNFRAEGSRYLCFYPILTTALGQFHGESCINFNFNSKERDEAGETKRGGFITPINLLTPASLLSPVFVWNYRTIKFPLKLKENTASITKNSSGNCNCCTSCVATNQDLLNARIKVDGPQGHPGEGHFLPGRARIGCWSYQLLAVGSVAHG